MYLHYIKKKENISKINFKLKFERLEITFSHYKNNKIIILNFYSIP